MMLRRSRTLPGALTFLLLLLLLTGPALAANPAGRVTWIHDGDTIAVAGFGKVRLLGIDTPERAASARDDHLLRQGVPEPILRRTAGQALAFAISEVKGRTVTLAFDGDRRDRHGRLLAYVTLPDGRLLNRLLLERGLAVVYRRFEFRLKDDFLAAEAQARQHGVGLWQK